MSTFFGAIYEAIVRRDQWQPPIIIGFDGMEYDAYPQANAAYYPDHRTLLELDLETLEEYAEWLDFAPADFKLNAAEWESEALRRLEEDGR